MRPLKIISGGQTGADQGALVAAHQLGIETGGWMPHGALTENGPAPALLGLYKLREHRSMGYPPRTRANVRDSDGTIWIGTVGSPGYRCTSTACVDYDKPFKVITCYSELREFTRVHNIRVLNVAGNRASRNPGIHARTARIIKEAFDVSEQL
jgi:hypothetical protein